MILTELYTATTMIDESYYVDILESHEVKPTSSRMLILRQLVRGDEALSMSDLERILPTVDKSTISRTLSLFLLHKVVHAIDDGSGSLKYAISASDGDNEADDEHTHFACVNCHRTFCLKQIQVPLVTLPDGFRLQSISYVLKGLCPECNELLSRKKKR